jgi:AcrR family transcriptional regulator
MQAVAERPPADPAGAEERALDAALRCIARWGLAKTTVDDVAREAGVGRATLYRLFPGGRDALLGAVVGREEARLADRVAAAAAAAATLEDVLVAWTVEVSGTIAGHAALQFLLAHEPESVLPHLAFRRLDALLQRATEVAGPLLAPWLPGAEDQARASEWVARVVLSYTLAPSRDFDMRDPGSARRFARTFVLPGLCTPPRPRVPAGAPLARSTP